MSSVKDVAAPIGPWETIIRFIFCELQRKNVEKIFFHTDNAMI
jgi:hypothetical protein